jgi:hypothetical protein
MARPRYAGELRPLEVLEQHRQGPIEHDGEIPVCARVSHQSCTRRSLSNVSLVTVNCTL